METTTHYFFRCLWSNLTDAPAGLYVAWAMFVSISLILGAIMGGRFFRGALSLNVIVLGVILALAVAVAAVFATFKPVMFNFS